MDKMIKFRDCKGLPKNVKHEEKIEPKLGFDEFRELIKKLCLGEFPCGFGSWRERPRLTNGAISIADKADMLFAITTKDEYDLEPEDDYGAQREKTEALRDYVESEYSPWCLDYTWSEEAKPLREIAVKTPWLISETFVLDYFRSLRMIERQITEIDRNFVVFRNLEELYLTGNKLRRLNSKNLPRNLKLLELSANEIDGVVELSSRPPAITHLGLGYNWLTTIGDSMCGDKWPELANLDLSFNHLIDLVDVIRPLQTLPRLRSLNLIGNPLCLIVGYKGFVLDALQKLMFLDDEQVDNEDRKPFKGLSKRKELVQNEVKIFLRVDYVKGIPQPEELKITDDQPEYPKVERKYFLRFIVLERPVEEPPLEVSAQEPAAPAEPVPQAKLEAAVDPKKAKGGKSGLAVKKDKEKEFPIIEVTTSPRKPQVKIKKVRDGLHLEAVDTNKLPWGPDLTFRWELMLKSTDVSAMRDFMMRGLDFALMEEVVVHYPVDQERPPIPMPTLGFRKHKKKEKEDKGKKGKESSGKKLDKKGEKSKEKSKEKKDKSKEKVNTNKKDNKSKGDKAAPPGKKGTKDDAKEKKSKETKEQRKDSGKEKKGKGKEPETPLVQTEPVYNIITHYHLPLHNFLKGENLFHNVFTKKFVPGVGFVRRKRGFLNNKPKSKKPPPPLEPEPELPKGKKPPAKPKKDEKKDKLQDLPPGSTIPLLETHLFFQLRQWKSAMDAVKVDVVEYSDSEDEKVIETDSEEEYYVEQPPDYIQETFEGEVTEV